MILSIDCPKKFVFDNGFDGYMIGFVFDGVCECFDVLFIRWYLFTHYLLQKGLSYMMRFDQI